MSVSCCRESRALQRRRTMTNKRRREGQKLIGCFHMRPARSPPNLPAFPTSLSSLPGEGRGGVGAREKRGVVGIQLPASSSFLQHFTTHCGAGRETKAERQYTSASSALMPANDNAACTIAGRQAQESSPIRAGQHPQHPSKRLPLLLLELAELP